MLKPHGFLKLTYSGSRKESAHVVALLSLKWRRAQFLFYPLYFLFWHVGVIAIIFISSCYIFDKYSWIKQKMSPSSFQTSKQQNVNIYPLYFKNILYKNQYNESDWGLGLLSSKKKRHKKHHKSGYADSCAIFKIFWSHTIVLCDKKQKKKVKK